MSATTSKEDSACKSCSDLKKLVGDQKEKMQILEKRLRDLVKAYKLVSYERDSLLACNEMKQQFVNKDDEQRISLLESNMAELSKLCGNYENDKIRYEKTIEKLTLECEELRNQLQLQQPVPDSSDKISSNSSQPIVTSKRNEWTQTDIFFDNENIEDNRAVKESNRVLKVCENGTQTINSDCLSEASNITGSAKKSELAIVLPTHREQIKNEPPSRSQSVNTPTSISSLDESYMASYNQTVPETRNASGTMFSLFYTTELARKDIELNEMKLRARETECSLRELQWRYNVDIYKLESKVAELEKQKRQLQSDSNFQPNLTYVRNVLLRFINTQDKQQRQCMISALLTALKIEENVGKG